jgi:hypothetical protein
LRTFGNLGGANEARDRRLLAQGYWSVASRRIGEISATFTGDTV